VAPVLTIAKYRISQIDFRLTCVFVVSFSTFRSKNAGWSVSTESNRTCTRRRPSINFGRRSVVTRSDPRLIRKASEKKNRRILRNRSSAENCQRFRSVSWLTRTRFGKLFLGQKLKLLFGVYLPEIL